MDREKTKQLIEAGPTIFASYQTERTKLAAYLDGDGAGAPIMPIAFGIECGDGWYELLMDAILAIEAEMEGMPQEERDNIQVLQVKEKFGTLRFYLSGHSENLEVIIEEAESRSGVTCEECGMPGRMMVKGNWMLVRCDDCKPEGAQNFVWEELP
jgi:ribosomal protein S27E